MGAPIDIPRAAAADPGALLDEAVDRFTARVRRELAVDDALALVVRCAACDRTRRIDLVLAGGPAHRDAAELGADLRGVLEGRSPLLGDAVAAESRACSCGAPEHLVRTETALSLRALPGSGAVLAARVDRHDGAPRTALFRVALGGAPEPLEGEDDAAIRAAFGRDLTLLGAWPERVEAPGVVELEPGVALVLGSREAVRAGVAARPAGVAVAITAETMEGPAWPARVRRAVEAAGVACLCVEALALERALSRVAARLDGRVRDGWLELPEMTWPLAAEAVPARMAREGRFLAGAAERHLDALVRAGRHAREVLEAAARRCPELRFEVEGHRARAVHGDGRRGPEFALSLLSPMRPDAEAFARDVAFLAESRPAWADPSRTCRCGAAAWLFVRPVPASSVAEGAWIVGEHGAWAEVVTVGCDRHVVSPRRDALRAWVDDLDARRATAQPHFEVDARVMADDAGRLALIARGPFIAAAGLDARLARGLCDGLAADLGPEVEARFAADGALALRDLRFAALERLDHLTRLAAGAPPETPLQTRRLAVGDAPAGGRFSLVKEA